VLQNSKFLDTIFNTFRLQVHHDPVELTLNFLTQADLCFLLIIIYNCSDQVLATRERRQASTQERAAQSVRESQAREKWKSAKDIAKKHAVGLQSQLSRTFSRKTSKKTDLKGFGSKHSDSSLLPSGKGKKKDKNNLSKIINDIEENPDNSEGFNLQIGDKNVKKQSPRRFCPKNDVVKRKPTSVGFPKLT